MCPLTHTTGVHVSLMFRPIAYSVILSFAFDALELFLSCQVLLNFTSAAITKAILLLILASDFLSFVMVILRYLNESTHLNFDVNFLLRMRIFYCPLSVFFFLFDHQSMGSSFVLRSASYGPVSSNQVDTIYKVKIIEHLPLTDNSVLPEFSSTLDFLCSRKIWAKMLPGEICLSVNSCTESFT